MAQNLDMWCVIECLILTRYQCLTHVGRYVSLCLLVPIVYFVSDDFQTPNNKQPISDAYFSYVLCCMSNCSYLPGHFFMIYLLRKLRNLILGISHFVIYCYNILYTIILSKVIKIFIPGKLVPICYAYHFLQKNIRTYHIICL